MDTSQTDSEIILRYKKSGELALLGTLFSRYTAMIYGVSLKYLKDRDDAKDAVMQVFEKLIITLKTHEVEHFKGWLYVTTRNLCLMQLRAKKDKLTREFSTLVMENQFTTHPEEEPGKEEDLVKLEKCIDTLEEIQQHCVRLFYWQEKCYKEITDLTGFDLKKVKSAIQNGKRNLKICMEKNG